MFRTASDSGGMEVFMKNKLIFKAGAVLISVFLCCTALFGCGKADSDTDTALTTPAADEQSEGQTTASKFSADTEAETNEEYAESASFVPDAVQSELNEAEAFYDAGMYGDADEMLNSIDKSALSEEQLEEYDELESMIAQGSAETESGFSAEDAVKIAEEAYGITIDGDFSQLHSQYDENGNEFYQMQVITDNLIKIIKIYKDGSIEEVSSEPTYG